MPLMIEYLPLHFHALMESFVKMAFLKFIQFHILEPVQVGYKTTGLMCQNYECII